MVARGSPGEAVAPASQGVLVHWAAGDVSLAAGEIQAAEKLLFLDEAQPEVGRRLQDGEAVPTERLLGAAIVRRFVQQEGLQLVQLEQEVSRRLLSGRQAELPQAGASRASPLRELQRARAGEPRAQV